MQEIRNQREETKRKGGEGLIWFADKNASIRVEQLYKDREERGRGGFLDVPRKHDETFG